MQSIRRLVPRKRSWLAGVLIVVPLLLFCSGDSPTAPSSIECVNTTYVLIGEPSYILRTENPVSDRGHLRKNCPAGGTYCYYLDSTPLFAGTKGSTLEPFVGKEVLIVGKHVNANSATEIWPGAICQLQCDGGSRPCLD